MNEAKPQFEGVEVTLAGTTYVVPLLNFKAQRQHWDLIKELFRMRHLSAMRNKDMGAGNEEPSDEEIANLPNAAKFLPLVHAAIAMNYPDVTLDYLDEHLTARDTAEFWKALTAALDSARPEKKMGEAKAVAT